MFIKTPTWTVTKMVLATVSPLQRLFDRGGFTHKFCNEQALVILYNDGYRSFSRFIGKYINHLNRGVKWADQGWKNFAHYWDLNTVIGIQPWPNAGVECKNYFRQAVIHWKKGNADKSFFYLGAASHLVQDLCVPHHASGKAFSGHYEYEKWVQERFKDYAVVAGGEYAFSEGADELVYRNAQFAGPYLPYVTMQNEIFYHEATSVLLSRAQRTTAGFFANFLRIVGAV